MTRIFYIGGNPMNKRAKHLDDADSAAANGDQGVDLEAASVSRIREDMTAWYAQSRRALPWRADRDAYRVLVSEVMLVQTTVAAVAPYFERFVARFPTVETLAAAAESEVLRAWEGLGYYRRARQLHAAARLVVARHGGRIPEDVEALRALPGVGRYIAGAVASIAFDRPAAILEANTQRVLARWLAWRSPLGESRTQSRLWRAAERFVPERGAGEFNQAFMELGALICLPREPRCLVCPVSELCRARCLGLQDSLPVVKPRPATLEVAEECALVVRSGRILVVQRGSGGLWQDMWEWPTRHVAGVDPAGRAVTKPGGLAETVYSLTGVEIRVGAVLKSLRYGVTKHAVTLAARAAVGLTEPTRAATGLRAARWATLNELEGFTLTSPSRKLADWVAKKGLQAIENNIETGL